MGSGFGIQNVLNLLDRASAERRYQSLTYFKRGIWTPELFFGGAQVGMTTSTKSGFWWAFNEIIVGHCTHTLTAKGSSVGAVTLTGLPFTSALLVQSGQVLAPFYQNMAGLTGNVFGRIGGSTKTITLETDGAATVGGLTDANFTNTSRVDLWFIYDAVVSECKEPTLGWWIPLDA